MLTRLVGSTYYSRLVLKQAEQVTSIDSRPSDSLALALQGKTPIFASKELMRQVILLGPPPGPGFEEVKKKLETIQMLLQAQSNPDTGDEFPAENCHRPRTYSYPWA